MDMPGVDAPEDAETTVEASFDADSSLTAAVPTLRITATRAAVQRRSWNRRLNGNTTCDRMC